MSIYVFFDTAKYSLIPQQLGIILVIMYLWDVRLAEAWDYVYLFQFYKALNETSSRNYLLDAKSQHHLRTYY